MVRRACVCLLVFAAAACAAQEGASRVVRTAQGPVRGYRRPDTHHYAFYSIPYATAPTGQHKFKEPLPPPKWEETFDAIDEYIMCPQNEMFINMFKTDINYKIKEDCLVINVFVPEEITTSLPVFVYVHGGGFQVGLGNMFIQNAFVESGKMIVVNFNYRLGAHGFLCLGTKDVPGNAGMKDQVAALHWVKNNIANFGGNPDDVTVAGGSAGSAAVELLLLSKSTRGLFNKVIPESGSGAAVWAVQNNPLEVATSYARLQGYKDGGDIFALEQFYKDLPFEQLYAGDFMDKKDSTMGFVPCVERKDSGNTFLTEAPINVIIKGDYEKLPLLVGFADMEGMLRLNYFAKWMDDMNSNFSDFLPADLHFETEVERQKVADKVKEFYFGDQLVSAATALGFVYYMSDIMFVYPAYRSLTLQAAAGSDKLYLYVYALAEDNFPDYPDVIGATHCAQSMALCDIKLGDTNNTQRSDDFKKVRKLLIDVWHNFIIKGNPTPLGSLAAEVLGEWRPTSAARPQHALFNATSELRGALWPARMALWDDVYSKYYRVPVPPPRPIKIQKIEL